MAPIDDRANDRVQPQPPDKRWDRLRRNTRIALQVIFAQLVGWALRKWLE